MADTEPQGPHAMDDCEVRCRSCSTPMDDCPIDGPWCCDDCHHAVPTPPCHDLTEPAVVTPSQADRQPPNPVSDAKGGLSAVDPGTTKHPDLVTHHEETT